MQRVQRVLKELKTAWLVLKGAALDFTADSCFRSSAALSFYTLFSIAPIVLITISVAGFFIGNTLIQEEISEQFRRLIGEQGAEGVFILMDTVRTENSGMIGLVTGAGILLFTATTIFVQIKNGFNEIFKVRAMEGRKGWIKMIRDRLVSLGIVFGLGFVMLISLVLDTVIVTLLRFLSERFDELSLVLVQVAQNLLILGIALLIIYSLFRWLPDAEVPGKYTRRGAAITTLLLVLGKFLIGWYIGHSNFSQLGGAAASIVILMLWVYYSSVILFFGAELMKSQALVGGEGYEAGPFAKKVRLMEIDDGP